MEKVIKILAFRSSKKISPKIFSEDFKINYYLFQAIYGDSAKLILTLILSFMLGTYIQFILVFVAFVGLRFLSGGYHAHSYENCFIITVGMFLITSIVAKYLLNLNINNIIMYSITMVMTILTAIYAPKFLIDETKEKLLIYKICSIGYVLLCYFLVILLNKYIFIPVYLGLMLQVLSVTPVGYKTFNYFDEHMKWGTK